MTLAKSLRPPTWEYLAALQDELQTLYRDDDNQIREARIDREMKRPALSGADQKYVLVHVDPRDSAVADESFREQASLSLERPKLTVKHEGDESDAAETNATLREHWTEQTLWTCGTREPGSDTMRDVNDAALFDGGGWTKLLWQKDFWEQRYKVKDPGNTASYEDLQVYDQQTEEAKKEVGPPFAWVHVDSLTIYPVWSGGRLAEVLEIKEAPLRSTLRRYRLSTNEEGDIVPEDIGQETSVDSNSLVSTAQIWEHWDETYATWCVTGTNYRGSKTGRIVKQFRHRYPFGVPYDFAPGLWMNHWKNRKVGWGISQTKQWLTRYRAYLRAMHAQYVARDLLSPLVRTVPQDSAPVVGMDGKPRDREDGPQPGTILIGRPGETYNRIDYPDATTLEKHMVLVDQAIEKLESPRVTNLSGLEGAGFAISQVLSYEAVKVGPITNSLQELLKQQTLKLWALVKMVGEKIYVEYDGDRSGYLGLGPEDLAKARRITWDIRPKRATDDLIKARYAHERLAAGTWGEDEATEFLGDNPDEIRRSKARDRIRKGRAYQMWQDQVVFEEAGRGDLLGKAAHAEMLANQGTLPGQMAQVPGVMGNQQVPDQGNLAMSPGGAGARLQPNGAVAGAGPGAVVPIRSAAGGVQNLGG